MTDKKRVIHLQPLNVPDPLGIEGFTYHGVEGRAIEQDVVEPDEVSG